MADGGASDGSSHFNLNPLYISSASKAGKDCKTIDSPTPALATVEPVVLRGAKIRCSYSVAILLISIAFVSSLCLFLYLQFFAEDGKWVDHHRLGFIAVSLAASIFLTEIFRNFKESRTNLRKGNSLIACIFGFYALMFLLLLIDPLLVITLKDRLKTSDKNVVYTKSCIAVEKGFSWKSKCMQNAVANGKSFVSVHTLAKKNLSDTEMRDALIGVDLFYSFLMKQILAPLVSASFRTECSEAFSTSLCMKLFQSCDQFCTPLPRCPSKCHEISENCNTQKELTGIARTDQVLENLQRLEPAHYVAFARSTVDWSSRKDKEYKTLGTFESVLEGLAEQLYSEIHDLYNDQCEDHGNPCWFLNGSKSEGTIKHNFENRSALCRPPDTEKNPDGTSDQEKIDILIISGNSIFAFGTMLLVSVFLWNMYHIMLGNVQVRGKRRSFELRRQGSKGMEIQHLSKPKRSALAWCGTWLVMTSCVVFYYCSSMEHIASTKETPRVGAYWWFCIFYTIFLLTFTGSVRQFSSALRGVNYTEIRGRHQRRHRNRCKRWYRTYLNLFGLSGGRYVFVKIAATEMWEVIVQFSGFAAMCQTSHVSYTIVALILMFLNITISPLLIMNRKHIDKCYKKGGAHNKWARVVVSSFDSFLDLGFLFNQILGLTLWSVDRTHVEVAFGVNISIMWPAVSIAMRMRAVKNAVLFRTVEIQRSTLHVSVLARVVSQKLMVPKTKLTTIQKKCETINRVLVTTVVLLATTGIGTIAYNLMMVYHKCSENMTPVLWDKAHPKKMFQRGIWELPTCGYGAIATIVVPPHSNVQEIPEMIGECKNLTHLELPYNGIKSLPKGLLTLQKVTMLNLEGNPAATKLYIDDIGLYSNYSETPRDHVFPTPIMCNFLKGSLVEISAKGNQIRHVNKCIKDFASLRLLNLENNLLGAGPDPDLALPIEFFEVSDNVQSLFRKNPMEKAISFANWNLCSKVNYLESCEHKLEKVVAFIKSHFHRSMEHIDFSGNTLVSGQVVRGILDNCTRLKRLDISKNKIASMLGVPPEKSDKDEWDRGDLYKANTWNYLEEINMDGNPVTVMDLSLAQYFELRPDLALHMAGWSLDKIAWGGRRMTLLPFRVLDKSSTNIILIDLRRNSNLSHVPILNADKLSLDYFCKFQRLKILMVHRSFFGDRSLGAIPNCFETLGTFLLQDHLNKTSIISNTAAKDNYTWPPFFWKYSDLQLDLRRWSGKGLYDIPAPVTFGNATSIEIHGIVHPSPIHRFRLALFPKLRVLRFTKSNLFGTLTAAWKSDQLEILDLRDNSLSGPIPRELLSNPKLKVATLYANPINGTLPSLKSSEVSSIECLHLYNTGIEGYIPRVYFENIMGMISLPILFDNVSNLSSTPPEHCYTNNNKQGCRYKDMYCQFEKIDRGHDDTFNPDHLDAILCLKRNGVFRNCASKDNDNIWTLL